MAVTPRKRPLLNVAWGAVLAVPLMLGYVLSYAPVYRMQLGAGPPPRFVIDRSGAYWIPSSGAGRVSFRGTAYGPVEWMIDETPLSDVLLWWGDVWGSGDAMRVASQIRGDLKRPDIGTK